MECVQRTPRGALLAGLNPSVGKMSTLGWIKMDCSRSKSITDDKGGGEGALKLV